MVEDRRNSGKIPPVIFLIGEDSYLKREYVDKLRRENPDPLNYEVFDGRECGGGEVISACLTLPFGPGRRVIVVRDADGLLDKDREALLEYMANPSPSARLVLMFDKLDKRSRLFSEARRRGWIRDCSSLSENKLLGLLRKKVRDDYGKDLSEDAARTLMDLVGTDMNTLVNEIEKLSLYVGNRRGVHPADVEEIVTSRRQPDIWALMGAVADKDEGRALRLYSKLIKHTSDVFGLLGLLRWNINRIWVGKEMLKRGASEMEIGRKLNVKSYYLNDFVKKACSFREGELYLSYRLLLKADWQIKTGFSDPRRVLERLIVALCTGG